MGVVEDVERVFDLVATDGTAEQRAWLERWRGLFNEAVERRDEAACEDLLIALIVWERTELRPPGRLFTLEEVAAEFGVELEGPSRDTRASS
jgi:hypothetical protein